MTFTPTAQQKAIIDASTRGESFVVTALAGTGKTTTLKQVCIANPDKTYLYIAFNASVAADFNKWVKKEGLKNVKAQTNHAIGRAYVHQTRYASKGLDIGKRIGEGMVRGKEIYSLFKFKDQNLIEYTDEKGEKRERVERLTGADLVAYVKNGVDNFCKSTDEMILPKHFDKYQPNDEIIKYAIEVWEDYNDAEGGVLRLPFNAIFKIFALDSPTMKYAYDPRDAYIYDCILIDEAQDTNPVAGKQYLSQTDLQIIYVGDPNQAIYGFLGAEDEMQKRLDLSTYALTESWRFGSTIAEYANSVLNKLKSPNLLQGNAPDSGVVELGSTSNIDDTLDAIVQRTNSGCLTSIFGLIELGIRPMVDADTKKGIITLVKSLAFFTGQGPKPEVLDEELADFETLVEIKKAIEKRKLPKRVQILLKMVEDDEFGGSKKILEIIEPINALGKKGVRITTTHKAKGLEWDKVLLGSDFFTPRWDFEKEEVIMPAKSELMLIYVAATRAKKHLYYPWSLRFIEMTIREIEQDLKRRYSNSREEDYEERYC